MGPLIQPPDLALGFIVFADCDRRPGAARVISYKKNHPVATQVHRKHGLANLPVHDAAAAGPALDVREIVIEKLGLTGGRLLLGTQRFERCSGPQTGARAEYASIPQPIFADVGTLDD